jgi:hypothetical protein
MLSRRLPVLASLGLVASVTVLADSDGKPGPPTPGSGQVSPSTFAIFADSDGKPYPPTPGGQVSPSTFAIFADSDGKPYPPTPGAFAGLAPATVQS